MAQAQNQTSQTAADTAELPARPQPKATEKAERAAVPGAPAAAARAPSPVSSKAGRNLVKLDIPRGAVKQVKVVDTDLVLTLEDGRTVYVRDGAVQAMVDPDFAVQFSDDTETSGQDLLHSADAADVGRIAITGASGESTPSAVTTEAPVTASAAPPPHKAPKWQTYALIGAPLLGGAMAGVLGGKSSSSGATTASAGGASKTATPVIFPVNGNGVVNKAQKESSAGVTISGTAEANASVTVLFGTVQKTATADANGAWKVTYATAEVPADAAQVAVSATAKSGTTAASDPATRDVRVDTVGPAAPQIDPVTGDNQISPTEQQAPVTVSGTSEANATLRLQWGNTTKLVVADAAGVWKTTFAVGEFPAAPGTATLTAVATDTAGNPGATASLDLVINPQVTITGSVTAGKVLSGNGLSVTIYAADGTTVLASGIRVSSTGAFTASNLAAATGDAVIAVVSDSNDSPDYLDEATGLSKNLGSVKLAATGIVTGATVTLNINPLTALAAQLAGLGDDGSGTTTAARVAKANQQIAKALGLGSTDITQIAAVATNGGQFNLADGASAGEKLGALLAAMSGRDALNNGDLRKSIADVLSQISNGQLTAAGQAALLTGAIKASAQVDASVQGLVADTLAQASAPTAFTIDTVAGDNIVSATEVTGLTVTGTVAAGASAVVLHFGARDATATISGTTWSYAATADDLAALGSGVVVLSADATLGDGSKASATRPIGIFTARPVQPTIDPIGGDSYINQQEAGKPLVITGSGTVGNKIALNWARSGAAATTTVGADGRWSVTYLPTDIPQDADNSVTVTATDQFGNVSPAATAVLHYDVIAPAQPTITPLNATNFVGLSAATTGVTFSGTGQAGEFVSLTWGSFTSAAVQVQANNTWSVSVAGSQLPDDGVRTVSVRQFDLAGNTSQATQMQVTVAKTPPPAPTILSVAGDSYVNLSEATNGFTVSGTGVAGQKVTVNLGDYSPTVDVGTDGKWSITFSPRNASRGAGVPNDNSYTLTAYATDAQLNRSQTATWDKKVVVDTQITTPTVNLDRAIGSTLWIGASARAAGGAYVLKGTKDVDVGAVTVTFTSVDNPATSYTFNASKPTDTTWQAEIKASNSLSVPGVTGTTTWNVTVKATDQAGNIATSAPVTVKVDTDAPGQPTLDETYKVGSIWSVSLAMRKGFSFQGNAEALSTVTLTWQQNGVVKQTNTVVTDGLGVWKVDLNDPDPQRNLLGNLPSGGGLFDLVITASDLAGNVSTPRTFAVGLAGATKTAPTITSVAADGVTAYDGYLNAKAIIKPIVVSGTTGASEAGNTVKVTWGGATGATGKPYATATVRADGTWSVIFNGTGPDKVLVPLADGNQVTISAQLSDATNAYSPDATKNVTIDGSILQPTIKAVNGTDLGAVGGTNVVRVNLAQLASLTASGGNTDWTDLSRGELRLMKGDTIAAFTPISSGPGNTWTANFGQPLQAQLGNTSDNTDGTYTLRVWVQDKAGNEAQFDAGQSLVVDTIPPVLTLDGPYAPVFLAGSQDALYLNSGNVVASATNANKRVVRLSGSGAEVNATVSFTLTLDRVQGQPLRTVTGSTTVRGDGTWTITSAEIDPATLAEDGKNQHDLIVTITDLAGNTTIKAYTAYVDGVVPNPTVLAVDQQTTLTTRTISTSSDYYYVNLAAKNSATQKSLIKIQDSGYSKVWLEGDNNQQWLAYRESGAPDSPWVVALPLDTAPTQGLVSWTVKAQDAAGNTGQTTIPLWLDFQAPADFPTINTFNSQALVAPAGSTMWVSTPGADPSNTTNAQFVVSGGLPATLTGEAGGRVRLVFTSTTDPSKSYTFDSTRLGSDPLLNRNWSATVSLPDDGYTLSYLFVDEAYNEGPARSYTLNGKQVIRVDHNPPQAPSSLVIEGQGFDASTKKVPSSYVAAGSTQLLTFTVRGDANSTATISFGNAKNLTVTLNDQGVGTRTVGASDFPPIVGGSDNIYTVKVTLTDRAGNTGPVLTYGDINFQGLTPTISLPALIFGNNVLGQDESTADQSFIVTLSDPLPSGGKPTVILRSGSTSIAATLTIVPNNSRQWTATFTAANLATLTNGYWTLEATATYPVGAPVTASQAIEVFSKMTPQVTSAAHGLDGAPAGAPFVYSDADLGGFTVRGKGTKAGDKVTLQILGANNQALVTQTGITVDANLDFSYTFTNLALAANQATAIRVTEAGNPLVEPTNQGSVTAALTYKAVTVTPQTIEVLAQDPATTASPAVRTQGTYGIGNPIFLRLTMSNAVSGTVGSNGSSVSVKLNNGDTVTFQLKNSTDTYLYATYIVPDAAGKAGIRDVAQLAVDTTTPWTVTGLKNRLDVPLAPVTTTSPSVSGSFALDSNRNTALDLVQPYLLNSADRSDTAYSLLPRFQIFAASIVGKTFSVGEQIQVTDRGGIVYASLTITQGMLTNLSADGNSGKFALPTNPSTLGSQNLVLTASKLLPKTAPGADPLGLVLRVVDPAGNITPITSTMPTLKLTVLGPDTVRPVVDLNGTTNSYAPNNVFAGSYTTALQPLFATTNSGSVASISDGTAKDSAGGLIASLTLKVDGLQLLTRNLLTVAGADAGSWQLNGKAYSVAYQFASNITTNSIVWGTDGSEIGAGKLTFSLPGLGGPQIWQITWDRSTRTFTFTPVDSTGQTTPVAPATATALIQSLRYADTWQNGTVDGARRFTITATDNAGNVSQPPATAAYSALIVNNATPSVLSVYGISASPPPAGGLMNAPFGAYRLIMSEAVQINSLVAGLTQNAALAGATVVAQDKFTLGNVDYATRFLITPTLQAAPTMSPSTQISLAPGSVIGTGAAVTDGTDTAGLLTFNLPANPLLYANPLTFQTMLIDGRNNQTLPSETTGFPINFVNAQEKTYIRLGQDNFSPGAIAHIYLNGVELGINPLSGKPGDTTPFTQAGVMQIYPSVSQWGRDGVKVYAQRAEDGAGNLGPWSDQRKFVVDSTAPTVTAVDTAGTSATNTKVWRITFSEPVTLNTATLNTAFGTGANGAKIEAENGFTLVNGNYWNNPTTGNPPGTAPGSPPVPSGTFASSYLLTLGTDATVAKGTTLSLITSGAITDQAGNALSSVTVNGASVSNPITVRTDVDSRTTLSFRFDNITSDNVITPGEINLSGGATYNVTISGAQSGDKVQVFYDGVLLQGGWTVGSVPTNANGDPVINFRIPAGANWGGDGEHSLIAQVTRTTPTGTTTIASQARSVYVATQTPHWAQQVPGTLWLDPDAITSAVGDPVTEWTGSLYSASGVPTAVTAKADTGTAPSIVLVRDPGGHMRLQFLDKSGQFAGLSVQYNTSWGRPSVTTGYSLFSEVLSATQLGPIVTTYVQAQATGNATGLASVQMGTTSLYNQGFIGSNVVNYSTFRYFANYSAATTADLITSDPWLNFNVWTALGLTSDGNTITYAPDDLARPSRSVSALPAGGTFPIKSPYLTIGGSTVYGTTYYNFAGMLGDQILIPGKLTAAQYDEISTYLAVKYQSMGSPVAPQTPVTGQPTTYDLTTNAPQPGGYPIIVDDILNLGQSLAGGGSDIVITAGPDWVNTSGGNDTIRITDLAFRLIDGSNGFDTLMLDRSYRNAFSGYLFNLSDYVSNARGNANVSNSGFTVDDNKRVNTNGFHKLQGIEKLDFSQAPESQTLKLTFGDIDLLADKSRTYTNDLNLPNSTNNTQSNLYVVLGSNDLLDTSGLSYPQMSYGYWVGPDGQGYGQLYSGQSAGHVAWLFVSGGDQGASLSGALAAVTRSADKVQIVFDRVLAQDVSGGAASHWSILQGSGSLSSYDYSKAGGLPTPGGTGVDSTTGQLVLNGTGFDSTKPLALAFKPPAADQGALAGSALQWSNFIFGTDGNDSLSADAFSGGANPAGFAIWGGAGNDTLTGSSQSDLLVSGTGNDTMTGGLGADVFRICRNDSGRDTITDFKITEGDRIDLRALLSNAKVGTLFNSDGTFNAANPNLKLTGVAGTQDAILYVDTGGSGNVGNETTPYSILLKGVNFDNYTSSPTSSTVDNGINFIDNTAIITATANGTQATPSYHTLAQLIQAQVVIVA